MERMVVSGHVTAVCLVLAMLLHLGLTQWGTQHSTVYCDQHAAVKVGPQGHPIFEFYWEVADTSEGLMAGFRRDNNCHVRAFYSVTGIFTRWGLSPLMATLAGVLAPGLLALVAVATTARKARTRIAAVLGASFLFFFALARFDAEWTQYRGAGQNRYLYDPYNEKRIDPPIIATGVSADSCKPCNDFLLWGFYPRENIPRDLALWGGMVTPLFLVGFAFALGLQSRVHRKTAS